MTETHQKRTACNRDCPDACGIVATIEGDRVVHLAGDPNHPVTQGFLCHRTSRFLERQYSPDRLISPMRRVGDSYEPICWEAALTLTAEKMNGIRQESGGAAILHYRCGGSLGMMKQVTDHFFACFGPVTVKSGDVCTGAGDAAQITDFGEEDSHDLFDLLNSRTIVLWGKNPHVSHVHLLPVLKRARANGAKIVLIDPVWHRTAHLCDMYLQPRPGGDIALALGMARVLLTRGLHDKQAPSYCDNFDEFRELALSRSLEEWCAVADVPPEDVELLAEEYARGPSAIMVGWGMQRRRHGSATVRTIDALGAISGNLGIPGGGVSFYFNRRSAFDFSFQQTAPDPPRTIPEPLLGPGILAAKDPPIRMVWVTAGNPVAMLPDSKAVASALKSREFTVVVDSLMTDTARCADLVLPTTTLLEEDDLLGAYGHHWLVESRPVVDAPPGVKSDYQILGELAPLVGLGGEFTWEIDTWKRRWLRRVDSQGASLEELRSGPRKNPLSTQVRFADRKFPTPSGRVNLIRQVEVAPPKTSTERPLLLTALSSAESQGSQWVEGSDEGLLPATIHPSAAGGLSDGAPAIIRSELGQLEVRLKFDARQRPDVLLVPKGGWLKDGRCGNALVRAEVTDAGECAVYLDTAVSLSEG